MNAEEHLDKMLDHAIEMTFPASDPFTIYAVEARVEETALGKAGQPRAA